MADIIFLAVIVAFFAVCVLYVNACDRIIGTSTVTSSAGDADTASTSPTATMPGSGSDIQMEVPA